MFMRLIFLTIGVLFFLSGCAGHYDLNSGDTYGFFSGLWHGLIWVFSVAVMAISWFLELFSIDFLSKIVAIGKPNTGMTYYGGYLIGVLVTLGAV